MRVSVFLLALAAAQGQDAIHNKVSLDGATHNDWLQHGGTNLFWRYSALDQVNTQNVKRLTAAWEFQTGDGENGLQATPIVADGVLYLSTSRNNVYALDAASGRLMWQYKYPQPRSTVPYGPQNRGVAIGDGGVFMGTYDNYLVAIDQKTGAERWKVNVEDAKQCGCNITGAPLVVRDKVIVGGTGGDSAHRGYLSAFDTKTGRLRWRFYTIPGPGEKGHETWKGDSWKFGGGATWMTGSYDPVLNLVYWGVGNAAADFDSEDRTGDNLYTNSVIALDADSGKLRWHFQEIPKDVWDFDSAYESVLIDAPVRGKMRKLLVHVNKGGFAFVLDRESGQFVNAYPIVDNYNWISGITENGKLVNRKEPEPGKATYICPGAAGGKSWNQVAYSPRTGFLYTPSLEVCNDIVADRQDAKEGASFFGGNFIMKPPPNGPAHSHVDAYDPVTGKRQWSFSYKYSLLASMLATAGDLVFTGDPEGNFFALDARSGEKLWSFQTGAGHRGSSVSYAVNGRQFIATPTGWGSLVGAALAPVWPEAETFRSGSTLIVFALPEPVH